MCMIFNFGQNNGRAALPTCSCEFVFIPPTLRSEIPQNFKDFIENFCTNMRHMRAQFQFQLNDKAN